MSVPDGIRTNSQSTSLSPDSLLAHFLSAARCVDHHLRVFDDGDVLDAATAITVGCPVERVAALRTSARDVPALAREVLPLCLVRQSLARYLAHGV